MNTLFRKLLTQLHVILKTLIVLSVKFYPHRIDLSLSILIHAV